MCEKEKKLKLCTCEIKLKAIHNKNSRNSKTTAANELPHYTWSLKRISGPSELNMDGLLIEPDSALDNELTSECILEFINESNCFDFDYLPIDGDNLEIRGTNGKFVSFMFENDHWTTGSHNPFTHHIEKFNSGNLKFETE